MARNADPAPDPGRLLSGLELDNRKPLAIAVSGGGDSVALLDLTLSAIATGAPDVQLTAITVDHGLRAESANEARWAAELCARLGIRHRIKTWNESGGGQTGLISRAREARYDLLAEAADEIGSGIILLGHTRDDQAETVAMRRSRSRKGQGWDRGGSGMARATLFENRIWLVRPLLEFSRASLRRHLRDRAIEWIEDPTNEDLRFERPRVRASLQADVAETSRLAREATWASLHRTEMGGRAADLVDRFARQVSPGLCRIDPDLLAEQDRDAALYAFRGLLATIGGTAQLPDHVRSAGLMETLERPGLCATLSRTRVETHREGIFLARESRDLPSLPATPGLLWDGRYRLAGVADGHAIMVAPRGAARARQEAGAHPGAPERLVRSALAAEPVLLREDAASEAIADSGPRLERLVSPFFRYLGEFDLALAGALSRLVGARPSPASPWAQHIGG